MKKISSDVLTRLVETQEIEFKKSLNLRKEGMKALDGMVNTDGGSGTVVFGVAPDGTVAGVDPKALDRSQQTLAQHIRGKFDPTLSCDIEVLDCEGKRLIAVRGTRPGDVPLHEYDGRAYIREGSTTRQLTLREKSTLRKRRDRGSHPGPWQCDRCGTWVGTLSAVAITDEGPKKVYDCGCGGEFWPAR
jgi:predicted HTH transcriptional regulator